MSDRFFEPLPSGPACWTCLHKHPDSDTCAAFPEGIPDEILDGTDQHREPRPGDGGIQYAPEAPP